MNIPDEAVEAAARALHVIEHGPWISGGGLTPGGTPWGTSREAARRDSYIERARAALEAATPYLLMQDRAEVWAEGHEEGFWNGRLSSGDTTGVPLIGKEHADATNPYRSQA